MAFISGLVFGMEKLRKTQSQLLRLILKIRSQLKIVVMSSFVVQFQIGKNFKKCMPELGEGLRLEINMISYEILLGKRLSKPTYLVIQLKNLTQVIKKLLRV